MLFLDVSLSDFSVVFSSDKQPNTSLPIFWPVRSITQAGVTRPATVIIQGIGIGMVSCVAPVTVLVVTILACKSVAMNVSFHYLV